MTSEQTSMGECGRDTGDSTKVSTGNTLRPMTWEEYRAIRKSTLLRKRGEDRNRFLLMCGWWEKEHAATRP